MIIMGYVKMIEGILEGKKMGFLDEKRINSLTELMNRLKTKDEVRNVADMTMFYFSSNQLACRLNKDVEREMVYSDYLSALAEVIHSCFSK